MKTVAFLQIMLVSAVVSAQQTPMVNDFLDAKPQKQ